MKRFLLSLTAMLVVMGLNLVNASTCADLNAVTSSSGVSFTLDQVTVVYLKAPYIYVQDATGTSLIYSNWNAFKRLQPGDVVSSVTGTAKLYSKLPELQPADSMITVVSGPAPAIPDATAAPTTADINKVCWFRDVDMGAQSFPSNKAQNLTGTFLGGSALFRNAWKEAYQFDSTKTYDILGCVAIYNTTIQVYAAQIQEHVESANTITLGFQAPEDWQSVYFYSWTEGTNTGSWPGQLVAKDSLGWSYVTFEGLNYIDYIWNNGQGGGTNQTVDLAAAGSKCERVGGISAGGQYVTSFAECGTQAPQPADTIPQDTIAPQPIDTLIQQPDYYTLRLSLASAQAAGWDTVHLFAWNDDLQNYSILGTWPGEIVELDSNGWYTASISSDYAPFNIIWGNGRNGGGLNQTIDIRGVAADGCYSVRRTNGLEMYDYILVDCNAQDSIPETPVDTNLYYVYFYNLLTRNYIDVQQVRAGEAAVLPEAPAIEGYDFIGWSNNDIDYIVANTYSTAMYQLAMDNTHAGELPITIRVKASSVPDDWQQLNIYSWTVQDGVLNTGYGAPMQLDSLGWYTYTLDRSVTGLDLLFNNGEWGIGNQTNDVNGLNASQCLQIGTPLDSAGYHIVYLADCEGVDTIAPQPQPEGITVRLTKEDTYGGWYGTYYVYAWQTIDSVDVPILGEWPGVEMNYDEQTNRYSYTFDEQFDNVNIVFSTDQGVQTDDIRSITEDACFQIGPGMGWLNGMYVHNYVQVSCDDSIQYHLVYFYGINGDFLAVVRVADGESAEAPVVPEVTGYTFMGWNQDFSHVTGQMNVYAVYQYNGASGDGITVRLLPTNGYGWENIYLYAWTNTGEPLGSWPGTLIPKDSTGWHAYTFTEDTLVNIVWNDGITGQGYTHQTQDIKNLGTSACYRLYGKDSIGFTTALTMDCDANPSDYHTIAYVDVDFNNELLLIGQVAHGAAFEYSPTIPQHEGIVFQCWANAVTGETFDTNAPITEDLLIDEVYNHVYYWAYLVDWDGTIIASGQFAHGISITNINEFSGYCYREGYEFIGWSDSLQNITSARISVAQYKPLSAGNYTITYSGKDGEFLDTQNIDLNVPVPGTIDGYMFVGWQVVGGSLEQGIQVQATYEPIGGSGAPATEGEQAGPRKVIRDNNIYILTSDGKIYTSDGKLVENK